MCQGAAGGDPPSMMSEGAGIEQRQQPERLVRHDQRGDAKADPDRARRPGECGERKAEDREADLDPVERAELVQADVHRDRQGEARGGELGRRGEE